MSYSQKYHTYHIVDPSPWPIMCSIAAMGLAVGATLFMHDYTYGLLNLLFFLGYLLFIMALWWRDVIREGTFEGKHTKKVQKGLKMGVILFILSEVMFFFAFFWAFFHSSLSPAIELGCVWPPRGIAVIDPWGIPLLNTIILVLSGVTITYAHQAILLGDVAEIDVALRWTLYLAFTFTYYQYIEFVDAPFTISDSVYGSTFYMCTGFHGLHVIIGSLFILVCQWRVGQYHFTRTHHVGFEAAAWYWHFVDVVWLFLFVMLYWWGGTSFDNYDEIAKAIMARWELE